MRTAVAALSSLEESLFASRSALNHVKDIAQTLALANAQITPAMIRPPRYRLVPVSKVARAKKLTEIKHHEYVELVLNEAYNQLDALGEFIQDHRERLDYHLFLVQERFQSDQPEIEQKYHNEIVMLKQTIDAKKVELNRLYDLKEADGKSDVRERLHAAEKTLQELRCESAERRSLTERIQQQKQCLQQVRDGNAKQIEACRSQLNELHKRIEDSSIGIDQQSILKQITVILRVCGASSHSLRAIKRILTNGFSCRLSDFDAAFPSTSESAQQALKATLAELESFGLVHISDDGVVAVGQLRSESKKLLIKV